MTGGDTCLTVCAQLTSLISCNSTKIVIIHTIDEGGVILADMAGIYLVSNYDIFHVFGSVHGVNQSIGWKALPCSCPGMRGVLDDQDLHVVMHVILL